MREIKFRAWNKKHKQMWGDNDNDELYELGVALDGSLMCCDRYYYHLDDFILQH
jgi:hypothetical protein